MPFDSTFTADEAEAAIAADPTIIDRFVPVLTKKDYVVRSKAADTTYVQNERTLAISEKTKEHATRLEKDVLELTGIPKLKPEENGGAEEKYYDYHKRAMKALKETEAELLELKKSSTLGEGEKQQLASTKEQIKSLNKKLEEKEAGFATELTKAKAEGKILMAVAGARSKYIKTLPASVTSTTESVLIGQMLAAAKFTDDNKMYFAGADGKPMLNATTQEFITADEYYAVIAKDMFDPGQAATGAGAGPGPAGTGSADKLPADITTKIQADEWLAKQGLVQGTKEHTKKRRELGIDKLPLR